MNGCRAPNDSPQGAELSQRFWQTAVQIVSIPPATSNGVPIYLFMGKPAMLTRWKDGTVPHKSGRCRHISRSINHTQTSLTLRYLPQTNTQYQYVRLE